MPFYNSGFAPAGQGAPNSYGDGPQRPRRSQRFRPARLRLGTDSAHESELSGINRDVRSQLAALRLQRADAQREFGYTRAGAVDPSNPFSRARLLERTYRQQVEGHTNQYAARGHLYSGALQNQLDEDRFRHERATTELRGAYNRTLRDLGDRRRRARQGAVDARARAGQARLDRALAQQAEGLY